MIWGILWHSKNKLNGVCEHLIYDHGLPMLFRTRKEAREWVEKNYGYIKHRKDLRGEPHGWRMPKPVKVEMQLL
jgi:hypothetical protein